MNIDEFLPQDNNNIHILHAKTKFDIPYNFYGHKTLRYQFNNVKNKEGLYCDSDNKLLRETIDQHISWTPIYIGHLNITDALAKQQEIDKRISIITQRLEESISKEIILCPGEYVDLIHPFHQYAFGHLFDTLQKLYSLDDIIKKPNIKFLVNRRYTNIKGFCEQLSALCERTITDLDLVVVDKTKEYLIECLHFGLSPVVPVTFCKETYKWLIQRYYKHFSMQPVLNINNLKYKLYCDRNHVRASSRGVLNNEEVKKYLIDNGFIVLTGLEDFSDIIHYFANAQIIIGAYGSLLINSVFSSPFTKVYEFCPNTKNDTSGKTQYKMCNKNYSQIIVEGDENHNITLDLNQLKDIIF